MAPQATGTPSSLQKCQGTGQLGSRFWFACVSSACPSSHPAEQTSQVALRVFLAGTQQGERVFLKHPVFLGQLILFKYRQQNIPDKGKNKMQSP